MQGILQGCEDNNLVILVTFELPFTDHCMTNYLTFVNYSLIHHSYMYVDEQIKTFLKLVSTQAKCVT